MIKIKEMLRVNLVSNCPTPTIDKEPKKSRDMFSTFLVGKDGFEPS